MNKTKQKKEYTVSLRRLFTTFFKIGLFTFGGGYAMLSVMEDELVQKRKWITSEQMLDMVAISESTPGPVAVNAATNLGFELHGVTGALVATGAEILPAFCIMFALSFFLNDFLKIGIIAKAFKGIQCAVAVLILRAGFNLFKSIPKKPWVIALSAFVTVGLLLIHWFSWNFSSLLFILLGAVLGFAVGICFKSRKEESE